MDAGDKSIECDTIPATWEAKMRVAAKLATLLALSRVFER